MYNLFIGFIRFFRLIGYGLILLTYTIIVSLIIVFPLWFIATSYSVVYTILVIILATCLLLLSLFKYYIIRRRENKKRLNVVFLIRIMALIGVAIFCYLTISAIQNRQYILLGGGIVFIFFCFSVLFYPSDKE